MIFAGNSVEGDVFLLLLIVFQWLLIIPHELGHALAARWLGYSRISILIGYGKPICTFRFLGFTWFVNRIIFGGLTNAHPTESPPVRWKWILFVSGGLIVNVLMVGLALLFVSPGGLWDRERTLLEIFILSNLLLIAGNLAPYSVQTPVGTLSTDGKLLLEALFNFG